MIYKSLLFKDTATQNSVSPDVISDLKIDVILPMEVTSVLLCKADKDSLLLRREMFKMLLSKENAVEKLTEISDSLSDARVLYTALNRALTVAASSYIFVYLFNELSFFCERVVSFDGDGFLYTRFSDTVRALSESEAFKTARVEAVSLTEELSAVKDIVIASEGESSRVCRSSDNCISERLKECAAELGIALNEKEESVIELQKDIPEAVAKLYPDVFARADKFYSDYRTLIEGEIFEYESELKFILGMLKFTMEAEGRGIPYCFPSLSDKKEISLKNVYDVTLLKKEGTEIVPNDVTFNESEPFFYLTGANGGGKTTYIRAVGVAMLFFLAGAPVFCESGEASLLGSVFTHFPRDERFEGSGRFVDEENRVNEILEKDDGNSLILLNETYSTTGEEKAIKYTEELAKRLYSSGSFGVYITHQHSVSECEIPFLSVVVDESDSNRRTYKIEKRRTESFSFAKDILKKYGLTADALKKRFSL